MQPQFKATEIPDVRLVVPEVFEDTRGFLFETYRADQYAAGGISGPFVQDNTSRSSARTLRGLHYQYPTTQGKLVGCLRGEILDVAVDIRVGSPTFGRWVAKSLSDQNHHQLYVPPGFAHGFLVLSTLADVYYKCTEVYAPANDRGIRWDDPALGIEWGRIDLLLSDRDRALPCLADVPEDALPRYDG